MELISNLYGLPKSQTNSDRKMHLVKRLIPATVMLTMSLGGIVAHYHPQVAVAQTQTPPRPVNSGMNFENKLLQQLNLTPEQTQKIQVIQDKYRTEIEQSMPVVRQASKEFRTLMDGVDTPTAQLRDKYRQMLDLQQKFSSLSFEHQLAIRDVLTPEQRRQKAAIMHDPTKMRALFQPSTPNQPSTPQPPTPNPKIQKHLLK